MGSLLQVLVFIFLVSLSIQSEVDVEMNNFLRRKGLLKRDDCFMIMNPDDIDRINQLKQDLKDRRWDVIVVYFLVHFDEMKSVSDFVWTMGNPEQLVLAKEEQFVKTVYSQESTEMEFIEANVTCNFSRDIPDREVFASPVLKGLLEFFGSPDQIEENGQACNGTGNCTEECGKAVEEPFLISVTYAFVVIILLYGPHLVYVFYDALHIKEDNLTCYHQNDWPYSIKRFLLKLSLFMVNCYPLFQKYHMTRPVTRSILILWITSILVQVPNMWIQVSDLSSKLAYKDLDDWMYQSSSPIMRYYTYGVIVIVGMVVTLFLLHVVPTSTYTKLLDDPYIFMLSSTGTPKAAFVKKSRLKYHIQHENRNKLTDGQQMIAMHVERFRIIFNPRFWRLLIRESFSGLLLRKTHMCWDIVTFIPVFLLCLLFFTLNVVINVLWGLFPLIGLFFSSLTLVNSRFELFRVCFLALYFTFFIIIVCGNNLVFLFNVMIHSSMYTIHCYSFDDLSKYSMVFPIILYLCFYLRKFTNGYRTILKLMFKLKSDAALDEDVAEQYVQHKHRESSNRLDNKSKADKRQKISMKEFDFVCSECSPVRERISNLLIKILVTGIFMILTLTIIFLRKTFDSFSKTATTIAFVVIIFLPKIIEKLWLSDDESKMEELEEKVAEAVSRWKFDKTIHEHDLFAVRQASVNCHWWNRCTDRKNEKTFNTNIHDNQKSCDFKEGSLTMLNTTTIDENV
ncbi:uncharacterized protein LOC132551142 [Ylistrum balloti]|uniref:uncharacterized protein LOC132551142 n=1 Tax=Ylistrum balloti TaxID=509963 RepID=UPI0029058467|nr:uncharacterized protein LOC132551142 [Ylistrum balloti]